MSGHGRGGSEGGRSGSRRQSQQRRPPSGFPPQQQQSPPPESPQPFAHALYSTSQYPQQRPGYSGQYMMSQQQPPLTIPHTPPPPSFSYAHGYQHVPEAIQSIHAGYPTLASFSQYPTDGSSYQMHPPSPQAGPSQPQSQSHPSAGYAQAHPFNYPPVMSPGYPYAQHPHNPSTSFSPPPPLYPLQGHGYSPAYHPGGGAQDVDPAQQGTWWYVPPQPAGPQYQYYPPSHPQPPPPRDGDYLGTPSPSYGARPSPPPSSPTHSSGPGGHEARPVVRRPYHPNPPAHRSEWVMWAGNVPSDAGHDELWRFFTQPPGSDDGTASSGGSSSGYESGGGGGGHGGSGVMSIFLISRSSCAFVNYETEPHLQTAITRFNGVPLRPADPRCARLVCRVRRKDDDLRAGVGGQRGIGMHTRWVKAKKAKATDESSSQSASDEPTTPSSGSDAMLATMSSLSISSSEEGHEPSRPPARPQGSGTSGSSGSYASTNSSFLQRHFPQRYFILKSLTRDDLDLSVQTGFWATQKHNEGILDRAFRTSKDVFLIFSVNKSGEFYGYARMAGPVGQADGRVSWASRSSDTSAARGSPETPARPLPQHITSGDHFVDASPQPFPTPTSTPHRVGDVQSAPPELGHAHRNLTSSPGVKYSLDDKRPALPRNVINLDEAAPFRAMRAVSSSGEAAAMAVERQRKGSGALVPVAEEDGGAPGKEADGEADGVAGREDWGQDFKLQWICTDRLPFQRTRHIRNPWNHDREVKVSRDGTELEPTVGQALLEEWAQYLAVEALDTPSNEAGPPSQRARESRSGPRS
ncbi:YT521-B-like domain-containing protein [Mycena rebaudengoi]|nr:YT521-B-like domain-containing protein [Mycena rebaudengoi]